MPITYYTEEEYNELQEHCKLLGKELEDAKRTITVRDRTINKLTEDFQHSGQAQLVVFRYLEDLLASDAWVSGYQAIVDKIRKDIKELRNSLTQT